LAGGDLRRGNYSTELFTSFVNYSWLNFLLFLEKGLEDLFFRPFLSKFWLISQRFPFGLALNWNQFGQVGKQSGLTALVRRHYGVVKFDSSYSLF